MNSELKLRIFDMEYGLREYDDIEYIRIVSDTYNLLIMKDYLPIIGEVDGRINIKGKDIDMTFDEVKAFYMNSDNVFNLMIKEG